MKYPSFLLLLIYSFACSGHSNLYSVLPGSNDKVTLFSGTESMIYYWAADRETLAHINYTLARQPDSPDKIETGKARKLSFEEIAGYQAGKEVVLFWWVLGEEVTDDWFKPACISNIILTPKMLQRSDLVINITEFTDCEPNLEI